MMLNIPQLHYATDSIQKKLFADQQELPRQMNAYHSYMRFDTTGRAASRKTAALQVPAVQPVPAFGSDFSAGHQPRP